MKTDQIIIKTGKIYTLKPVIKNQLIYEWQCYWPK